MYARVNLKGIHKYVTYVMSEMFVNILMKSLCDVQTQVYLIARHKLDLFRMRSVGVILLMNKVHR